MEELKPEEWEVLPPNTSFLDYGLEDIKDLFSNEIDYMDYFIEQRPRPPLGLIQSGDEKTVPQAMANKIQVRDEEFGQEIEVEDQKQGEMRDNSSSIDMDDDDSADNRRCKPRRRPIVAGIGEMLSVGAAVAAALICGFLLGSSRRQEQLRRDDAMRFRIYKDEKALKQMVRQANRMNQVLVATAGGMPPPVMQPAIISFGRCFGDML